MGTQHVYDVSAAIKNGAAPPSSVPSSTTSGEASQKVCSIFTQYSGEIHLNDL